MEKVKGILEVLPDGFGFLRGDNYLSTENDVYVSPSQIKSLRLRTGDVIEGEPKEKKETERDSNPHDSKITLSASPN